MHIRCSEAKAEQATKVSSTYMNVQRSGAKLGQATDPSFIASVHVRRRIGFIVLAGELIPGALMCDRSNPIPPIPFK